MGTSKRSVNLGGRPRRQNFGNPRLEEQIHDPYRGNRKVRTPRRCPQCGATYLRGRWRWQGLTPPATATLVCPACHRVNDRYPAGEVIVSGSFAVALPRRMGHALEDGVACSKPITTSRVATPESPGNVTTDDVGIAQHVRHDTAGAYEQRQHVTGQVMRGAVIRGIDRQAVDQRLEIEHVDIG